MAPLPPRRCGFAQSWPAADLTESRPRSRACARRGACEERRGRTSERPSRPRIPSPASRTSGGTARASAYFAPTGTAFWTDDGGIDVVVHFNAAMLAGRSWQTSGANAVIVSAAFGAFGSGAY
ncbi:MAG: hypothetical protein IPF92_21750 [Myxococcales bacterium]|nr:hypothetical protein [Myxococcales bacterium]